MVQLTRRQDRLADRARAEERNRIAGEMHDVIGHALTVSLLHISSARLALDEDPDEAGGRWRRPSGSPGRASTRCARRWA